MAAWGAPAEDIERVRAQVDAAAESSAGDAETFGVYAENLPIVHAFTALRTQWQYAGMGGTRVGFLYAGVIAWINTNVRRRHRRALLSDLQLMEGAVLTADHELREQERGK